MSPTRRCGLPLRSVALALFALVQTSGALHMRTCGSSRQYWSTSCGPIGSASSRYCSEGGHLVYNTSCATHFKPGSRGCGVLFMGCQSLCIQEELPCQTGQVSLLQESFTTNVDDDGVFRFPLMRRFGDEGNITVSAKGFTDTGVALAPTNVSWNWGDSAPKYGQLSIPRAVMSVLRPKYIEIELESVDGARLGHVRVAKAMLSYEEPACVLKPLLTSTTVSVSDQARSVVLSFERQGDSSRPANASIMYVGGNATRFLDFHINVTQHPLIWGEGVSGERTVTVQLHRNLEFSGSKTIHFLIFDAHGIEVIESVITVIVEFIASEEPLAAMTRKREALPWTDAIVDVYARDRFVASWEPFYISPGQVIVDVGDLSPLVFAVYSGKFRIESHLPGLNQQRYLKRGELIGALSALHMRRNPMRIVARSSGILYAISPRLLNLHASAIKEVDILKTIKSEFLRSLIINANHKSPIVLIPGLMSTRLQAWQKKDCLGVDVEVLDQMWLNLEKVMQTLVVDEACWMDCIRLEKHQRDPADCKIRAMSGISAISELHEELKGITTIFRSLISLLADKWGYDSTSILPIPYDWRLSPDALEARDSLFSRMKLQIEQMVAIHKLPAIVIGHSMGNNVLDYFVAWMKIHYADSYEKWFSDNILAHYGIASPLAGSIKAVLSIALGDPNGLPFTFHQARRLIATYGSSVWLMPRNDSTAGRKDMNLNTLRFQRELPLQSDTEAPQGPLVKTDGLDLGTCAADSVPPCPSQPLLKDTAKEEAPRASAWPQTFSSFRFANGEIFNVTMEDISSGDIWRVLAEKANDSLAASTYDIMKSNYLGIPNQQLNPLASPPSRPPIRHVAMIYGVDITGPYHMHFTHDGVSKSLELKEMIQEGAGGMLVDGTGSVVGRTGLRRGGDGTVPYASLSWAHSWHVSDRVKHVHTPSRVVEYYEHLLGKWGERTVFSIMNTEEPEHDRFDSESGPLRTTVIEIVGMEHRDAVRNAFGIQILDNLLEELVAATLNDDSDHPKVVSTGPSDDPREIDIDELVDELIDLEILHTVHHKPVSKHTPSPETREL